MSKQQKQRIGYLIDPEAGAITEVPVDDDPATVQALVGGYFEAHQLASGDFVLVDEDGGMKGYGYGFIVPTMRPTPGFVGKGVVIGYTIGGNAAARPKIKLPDLIAQTRMARKP